MSYFFLQGYYTIDNFNLDDRKLPPFVPGGRYKFQLTGLKKGYTIVKASVYGEIIYKNKQ